MAQEAGLTYLVFARRKYEEPLRFQREWSGSPETQVVMASIGQDWLEVVLVPTRSIRWVVRPREEAHVQLAGE